MTETVNKMDLRLFDGAAAAGGASGTSATAPSGTEATTEPAVGYRSRKQAAAERERMAKNAIMGKAEQPTTAQKPVEEAANADKMTEEKKPETSTEEPTPAKKSGAEQLEEMMKDPEFRKAFSDKAQGMFDKRFKESKGLQAKFEMMTPLIETLSEKYGTDKNDIEGLVKAFNADGDIYEALGEKHGMSGQQYKAMMEVNRTAARERELRMEIEARIRTQEAAKKIQAESEALRQTYPEFDLQGTLANPQVREMLKSGVSLKAAYEAANIDKIIQQKTMQTEKKVVENIQARSERPVEGGATSQHGAVAQNLATKLTKQERERLAQRAIRGEKITLH